MYEMQSPVTIHAASRPKRVVFLLDPEHASDDLVNDIFVFSNKLWGGAYYAIVPVMNGTIEGEWWSLLALADPDIVYSFVPLSESLVRRIDRFILPMETCIPRDTTEKTTHISDFDVAALGVEDIPRFLAGGKNSFQNPFFLNIKHPNKPGIDARFLVRNFGVFHQVVTIQDSFADLPYQNIEPSTPPADFLKEVLELPRLSDVYTPADLSAVCVPQMFIMKSPNHGHEFHLVVGDSPWEAIYTKNRPLVTERYLRKSTLWLSYAHTAVQNKLNLDR